MQSLWFNKSLLSLAAGCGILLGFLLIQSVGFAGSNPYVPFAFPLLLLAALVMVLNKTLFLLILLLSRVLLDPWLNSTRISFAGDQMGLGAAINLAVIVFALTLVVRQPGRITQNPVSRHWIFFLLFCLAATFYSPVPGKAIKSFFALTSYLSMLVIPFYMVRNEQDKRFWLKIIFTASVLPVLYGNYEFIAGTEHYAGVGQRVQSTFSHPNIFAFYLVFQMALATYYIMDRERPISGFKKAALFLYFANLAVLLVATKTRNAWLACWIFFFVFGLLKSKKLLFWTVALPPLLLLEPAVQERLQDLFYGQGSNLENKLNSFAWRMELWKRAFQMILERWHFGHGLASFKPLSYNFFPSEPGGGTPAHSAYIEILFEMGLAGLLIYLSIYISLLKIFWIRSRRWVPRISNGHAVFFAYIVCYLFSCAGDNMQDYLSFNWYVWFAIGIVV